MKTLESKPFLVNYIREHFGGFYYVLEHSSIYSFLQPPNLPIVIDALLGAEAYSHDQYRCICPHGAPSQVYEKHCLRNYNN